MTPISTLVTSYADFVLSGTAVGHLLKQSDKLPVYMCSLPISGSGPAKSMPLDANNLEEQSLDAEEGVSDVTLLDWRWHLSRFETYSAIGTFWRLSDSFCHARSDPLTQDHHDML